MLVDVGLGAFQVIDRGGLGLRRFDMGQQAIACLGKPAGEFVDILGAPQSLEGGSAFRKHGGGGVALLTELTQQCAEQLLQAYAIHLHIAVGVQGHLVEQNLQAPPCGIAMAILELEQELVACLDRETVLR